MTLEELEQMRKHNIAIALAGNFYLRRDNLIGLRIAEKLMEVNLLACSELEEPDERDKKNLEAMEAILFAIRMKITNLSPQSTH